MVESFSREDFREGVQSYMDKRPPKFARVCPRFSPLATAAAEHRIFAASSLRDLVRNAGWQTMVRPGGLRSR